MKKRPGFGDEDYTKCGGLEEGEGRSDIRSASLLRL